MSDIHKILNNLRRQCSRREYCTADVLKKAQKALEGDAQGAQQVVQTLVEEKYVDDGRYAQAYAREKASISGWGRVKIGYMLSGKGIARNIIDQALQEIEADRADARLEKLIQNKYRTLKDDPQWKMKLLRFALGRGYTYGQVSALIDALPVDFSRQ